MHTGDRTVSFCSTQLRLNSPKIDGMLGMKRNNAVSWVYQVRVFLSTILRQKSTT